MGPASAWEPRPCSTLLQAGATGDQACCTPSSLTAAVQETRVHAPGQEDPLEEGMATHTSTLAWRIPMDRGAWRATVHGVQRVATNTFTISAIYSQKTHFFLKYSVSGNAFPSHTQSATTGGTLNLCGEWAIPKDSTWQAGRPEVVSHHVRSGPDLSRQPGRRGTPPITRRLKFTPPWDGPGAGRCCQQ